MLTPAGLVVALLLSAPALYDATNGSLALGAALLRLLAALVLVAIGTAVLRKVLAPQAPHAPHAPVGREDATSGGAQLGQAGRRRDDG
jgi:hypothetical protein